MFGSNFRDFVSQDTTSHDQSNPERLIKNWHGFEKPDSEDSSIEEEFEILESKNQGGAKGHHHSGDSGIEGEKESEISGDRSQPENKLQYSSFEDDYEIIEVSDLDKIQIAGFSKQELLEMCNFCKISYGNNDEKLDSRYKTKAALVNEGYGIIPFYYKKKGTPAGFVFTKDKEITIAYRGTKDLDDVMTDVSAAFTQEFSPEGGKMHSGFYNAFKDSWRSLEKILNNYAKEQGSEIKSFRINCTGHSMGAALATITALYLKEVKSAEHVRVVTFGSPRVFDSRGAKIYERLLGENTIRVTNLSDPIPMFPPGSMGFKHVGEPLKIKTGNFIVNCLVTDLHIVGKYYHKTDTYYGCIQDMKPEDFQPDNNVSRYYYLSYVVAVPYYIATTALTTPCYLFLSAISNTEQRYFERETKFADDQVSLKDNRNGLVIYTYSNAIADPLIRRSTMQNCSDSELSQQPQENVDRRENIINNEKASIEEAIGNDYRRSKMGKDIKTIEEKLSNAIDSIDYVSVIPLLKKLGDSACGPTLQKLLSQANDKMTSLGEGRQKEDLAQIIALLKNELKHTAAVSPVDGTTASSHGAPVIEPESEGNQSDSLSSEDDDYSRLESGKSAGTFSGNGSPFEEVPSIATKEAKVNDEQSDNINDDDLTPVSSPVSGDVLTSRSDEEELVVITTRQPNVPGTPVLGQIDDTKSLSTQDGLVFQSGSLNPIAGMENTQNLQSAVLSSQQLASRNIIEIFNKHGREGFTPLTLKLMVQELLNDGISRIQLPTSNGCITFDLNVINEESPEGLQNMLRAYINSSKIGKAIDAATNSSTPVDTKSHVFQDSATLEGSIDIDDDNDYGLSEPFSEEDSSNRQEDPMPLPIPTPGPTPATPILPKKPGQADAKSNCCQSNNGSITVTQSIQKSTVATWTFAVAGILAGAAAPAAYFAFSVSLLTTGIIAGVGVCCLVAAVIIYCCNRPSNSLECNNVGPVADRKLVG